MADRVEDVEVAVGGRGGAVVDDDFAVDQVGEVALRGVGAVQFFDQRPGGVEDLDRVGGGVGDVDVAERGGVFGDRDAVGFQEFAGAADLFQQGAGGAVFGDVGAVGDVEVAGRLFDGEAGRVGGVDHRGVAGQQFGGGVFDDVFVPVVDVEVPGGIEFELAGTRAGALRRDLSAGGEYLVMVVVGDVEAAAVAGQAAGVFEAAVIAAEERVVGGRPGPRGKQGQAASVPQGERVPGASFAASLLVVLAMLFVLAFAAFVAERDQRRIAGVVLADEAHRGAGSGALQMFAELSRRPRLPPKRVRTNFEAGASGSASKVARIPPRIESTRASRSTSRPSLPRRATTMSGSRWPKPETR